MSDQPGTITTPAGQQRWMPCYNTSKETAPPYALMMIDSPSWVTASWRGATSRDGQNVWLVKKPDYKAAGYQSPVLLVVNGPTPIPPESYGQCTQDWPARVLHLGGDDSLPNGCSCGPREDSWAVWSDGDAFLSLSHDYTLVNEIDKQKLSKNHLVWIGPARKDQSLRYVVRAFSGVIPSGNDPADSISVPWSNIGVSRGFVDVDDYGLQVTIGGLYQISYGATISSSDEPTAPSGNILSLALRIDDETSSIYRAFRLQNIVKDQYGNVLLYTAENVAFSGIVYLTADSVLRVVNASATPLTVASFLFSVHYLGMYSSNELQPGADNPDA